jgi:hypothetical protein
MTAAPRKTLFTIVTPVFNGARYLDETILSILAQSGPFRLRYHVQDGGSGDGTLEKLAAWKARLAGDFPILCEGVDFSFASAPDRGLYDALSRGFAQAGEGDVMSWLNADDRLEPGCLHSVAGILERFGDVDWIGGRSTIADETGAILVSWPIVPFPRKAIAAGIFDGRFAPPFIQQEGTFWRARLWRAAGGVDPAFRLAGDFDLWRRFARHADLVIADTVFGCWRRREGQLSADKAAYQAEIDRSLAPEAAAARAAITQAYREASARGRLGAEGFGYRILSRPDLGDWVLQDMPLPGPAPEAAAPGRPGDLARALLRRAFSAGRRRV